MSFDVEKEAREFCRKHGASTPPTWIVDPLCALLTRAIDETERECANEVCDPRRQGDRQVSKLTVELEKLLNRHSAENESNTPDYILADYMMASLRNFEEATQARDAWYGMNPEPGTDWAKRVPEPPRLPPSKETDDELA